MIRTCDVIFFIIQEKEFFVKAFSNKLRGNTVESLLILKYSKRKKRTGVKK